MSKPIKTFESFYKKLSSEKSAGLSSVWQHIQKRTAFAMVSLSRADMSSSQKETAFNELKRKIRAQGYGYIELKSCYIENEQAELYADFELAVMILNIEKKDALALGQVDLVNGTQNTILYCDGKDFLEYIISNPEIGTVGSTFEKFEYGSDKDVRSLGKEAVIKYFAMLTMGNQNGKKISFEELKENHIIFEMRDRKYAPGEGRDWWDEFGMRII
jgi:hypothetical protein